MAQWSSEIMNTWVTYHITRTQLKEGIDDSRLVADKDFYGGFTVSAMIVSAHFCKFSTSLFS